MGEIRKVVNGEFVGNLGDFNGELLGQPFVCVYGEVKPRTAEGHTLIEWPLCGKLNTYIRFNTSEEFEKHMQDIGEGIMSGTLVFTEELAENFGLDKNDVMKRAMEFTNQDYYIKSMLAVLMGDEFENMAPEEEPTKKLKVVSTKHASGFYGSGVLASETIMGEIREEYGDFYVIPSSLHEIIVIPKGMGEEIDHIKEMIREVNATVVDSQDILSGHLYLYDSEGLHEL